MNSTISASQLLIFNDIKYMYVYYFENQCAICSINIEQYITSSFHKVVPKDSVNL